MTVIQLRPGYWFNIEDMITAKDQFDQYTKVPVLMVFLKHQQAPLKLMDEERQALLDYFARHAHNSP